MLQVVQYATAGIAQQTRKYPPQAHPGQDTHHRRFVLARHGGLPASTHPTPAADRLLWASDCTHIAAQMYPRQATLCRSFVLCRIMEPLGNPGSAGWALHQSRSTHPQSTIRLEISSLAHPIQAQTSLVCVGLESGYSNVPSCLAARIRYSSIRWQLYTIHRASACSYEANARNDTKKAS